MPNKGITSRPIQNIYNVIYVGYVYSIWSTYYHFPFGYFISVHFGLIHLIHISFLGSPLRYRMLILDLTRNLFLFYA